MLNTEEIGQECFDAAVVSQRALDATKGLKGAGSLESVSKLPGAFPIQDKS